MRSLLSLAVIVLALTLAVAPALAGEVTGKVQKVDTDQKMVTLEDGTQIWLAEGATADSIKEGAKLKVSYDEKDGKNWATSFEILPE